MSYTDDDDAVGGKPLIEIVNDNKALIAPFRAARFEQLYEKYESKAALTADEQQFILRCGADLLDNKLF